MRSLIQKFQSTLSSGKSSARLNPLYTPTEQGRKHMFNANHSWLVADKGISQRWSHL